MINKEEAFECESLNLSESLSLPDSLKEIYGTKEENYLQNLIKSDYEKEITNMNLEEKKINLKMKFGIINSEFIIKEEASYLEQSTLEHNRIRKSNLLERTSINCKEILENDSNIKLSFCLEKKNGTFVFSPKNDTHLISNKEYKFLSISKKEYNNLSMKSKINSDFVKSQENGLKLKNENEEKVENFNYSFPPSPEINPFQISEKILKKKNLNSSHVSKNSFCKVHFTLKQKKGLKENLENQNSAKKSVCNETKLEIKKEFDDVKSKKNFIKSKNYYSDTLEKPKEENLENQINIEKKTNSNENLPKKELFVDLKNLKRKFNSLDYSNMEKIEMSQMKNIKNNSDFSKKKNIFKENNIKFKAIPKTHLKSKEKKNKIFKISDDHQKLNQYEELSSDYIKNKCSFINTKNKNYSRQLSFKNKEKKKSMKVVNFWKMKENNRFEDNLLTSKNKTKKIKSNKKFNNVKDINFKNFLSQNDLNKINDKNNTTKSILKENKIISNKKVLTKYNSFSKKKSNDVNKKKKIYVKIYDKKFNSNSIFKNPIEQNTFFAKSANDKNITQKGKNIFFGKIKKNLNSQKKDNKYSFNKDTLFLKSRPYINNSISIKNYKENIKNNFFLNTQNDQNSYLNIYKKNTAQNCSPFIEKYFNDSQVSLYNRIKLNFIN